MIEKSFDPNAGLYVSQNESRFHHRYVSGPLPDTYKQTVLNKMGLKPQAVVLDIGGGTTEVASYLEKGFSVKVFTTDISKEGLTRSKTKKVAVAEANSQPFQSSTFDLIHCKDMLVHIEDLRSFLLEINRLLKHEGVAVLTFWEEPHNRMDLYFGDEREDRVTIHIDNMMEFSKILSDLKNQQNTSGLNIEAIKEYYSLSDKAKILSVSPPYFRHTIKDLQRLAEEIGFNISSISRYKNSINEVDWTGPERYVVTLKKDLPQNKIFSLFKKFL